MRISPYFKFGSKAQGMREMSEKFRSVGERGEGRKEKKKKEKLRHVAASRYFPFSAGPSCRARSYVES